MNDSQQTDNPFASPQLTDAMSIREPQSFGQPGEDELPSRWLRLGAHLLDSLILSVISFPVGIAIGVGAVLLGIPLESFPAQMAIGAIGFVIGILIILIVNGYLLMKHGQTVGKLACGLRIVAYEDRQLKSLGSLILLRYAPVNLLFSIPVVGPIVGLIFALIDGAMIFTPEKRCLHDYIAGTIVVKA